MSAVSNLNWRGAMSATTRKYFGTDGVRGQANSSPMTAEEVLKLGMSAGNWFRQVDSKSHRVVIGKDTRRSGYMLENALTAGLTATGMNVLLLGPVPTPAVGLLTRSMRADLGIMISASHNPYHDNGLKFFGPDGFKLSDEAEAQIEQGMSAVTNVPPEGMGRAKRIDDGLGRYVEYAKTTFPKHLRLDGMRVVVDCANGAGYKAAPEVLWELGAEVVPIGVSPDGFNINAGCGSTSPALAAQKVLETRADVGLCLDGDADRLIVIDDDGQMMDGDQLLALFAKNLKAQNRLPKNTVVASIISNMGMETHLKQCGISVCRTPVGDRYVVDAMRQGGYNLGGEQSGHVVMLDQTTAGDGLIAGLQFLSVLVEAGSRAKDIAEVFQPVPQVNVNVRFSKGLNPLEDNDINSAILAAQKRIEGRGRLLVRKSGTEPMVRIMAEGGDTDEIRDIVGQLESLVADYR